MVKVLVATTEAQGYRTDDYACAVDGELVYVPVNGCHGDSGADVRHWCAGHELEDDTAPSADAGAAGECQCSRGFTGMASSRATTTALVVERLDLTVQDLWTALSDSLERQGRLSENWTASDGEVFRALFQRMLATASHFPIGSIIERRGDRIRRRAMAEPLTIPSDLIGGES